MAKAFTIILETTVGGYQQLLSGKNVTLRKFPWDIDNYTLLEIATGTYKHDMVENETYRLYIDGVYQTNYGEFYIADDDMGDIYLKRTGGTMSGNIAMGGNKLTGLGAGNTTGDSVRYEQVAKLGVNEIVTGQWTFQNLIPKISSEPPNGLPQPSQPEHLVSKEYTDNLFGSVIGVVQSTFLIKCLPTRSINDNYSRQTLEDCRIYLNNLLLGNTKRGIILIEPTGTENNILSTTGQWISNRIDIFSVSKVRIDMNSIFTSITSDSKLINCYIYSYSMPDDASRTFINFEFQNCDIELINEKLTLSNCIFKGINRIKLDLGSDLTLTNCKGTSLWTNAKVIISGIQPIDVRSELNINNLW